MKKEIGSLAFSLFLLAFSGVSNAGLWDAWADEDEENYSSTAQKTNQSKTIRYSSQMGNDANAVYFSNENNNYNYNYNQYYSAPVNGEMQNFSGYYQQSNPYVNANVDYDTLQSERVLTPSEVSSSINKWKNGVVSVFWENYRGNNVRIELLRNNRDLKEMRLKFVQSQNMTSDPDGSISDMLNVVANQVMKRTCGRKAKQSIILYERPSVELEKETAADGYKVMAKGTSLKEYGFRCIY